MRYKTYRMWQAFMGMIVGGVTGASIGTGYWMIPIPTVIISVLIIIILRRKVKEIVTDERVYAVAEKAARLTLIIIAIGMAVTGATLLLVSRGDSSVLTQVGFTLVFATCGLLIINYITYFYFSRKLGGQE